MRGISTNPPTYKHAIRLGGVKLTSNVDDPTIILTPTNLPPSTPTGEPIKLNASMEWKERFQSFQVAQSVNRTVGGRAIVFATPLRAGRKITLEATQEHGWISHTTANDLMQMAASVGGTFELSIGLVEVDDEGYDIPNGDIQKVERFNVIFRHNEPPALELSPLVHRAFHEPTDFFIGSVKLITI